MADDEFGIVDALLSGDEAAFEQLVGRYHGRLLCLARTYVRSEAHAAAWSKTPGWPSSEACRSSSGARA
jgi:hypothetical protein